MSLMRVVTQALLFTDKVSTTCLSSGKVLHQLQLEPGRPMKPWRVGMRGPSRGLFGGTQRALLPRCGGSGNEPRRRSLRCFAEIAGTLGQTGKVVEQLSSSGFHVERHRRSEGSTPLHGQCENDTEPERHATSG